MTNPTVAEAIRTLVGQRFASLKTTVVGGNKIEITLAYRNNGDIRNPQAITVGIAEWTDALKRHMSREDGYGHYTGLDSGTIDGVDYVEVEHA